MTQPNCFAASAARSAAALFLLIVTLVVPACSLPSRGAPVPDELTLKADVPGLPNCRFTADADGLAQLRIVAAGAVRREVEYRAASGQTGPLPPAVFLAVSGGGARGAYGAGVICAWTETGTRPDFKVVTGISTGALIAPFAFLGPDYDHVLREVYTTVSTNSILRPRSLLAAIFDDALADTAPLYKLLSEHVDEEVLARIADEHRKGRLLLVGTTNLDAQRAVVWDIGAIASHGGPDALELVRKVLIASASIPGALPPVMIDVEADGAKYQEMHVDGGASTQVFLYPPELRVAEESESRGISRERKVYIIRNARLDPSWASTQRQTIRIAARAISSLIATQGMGDLYRMYLTTNRDGVDFNLAYIPADFDLIPKEEFDPVYMKALFEVGREQMLAGTVWFKTPPSLDDDDFAPPAGK